MAKSSSPAENAPPARGLTFAVADHVLIQDFLRRKVAGLPIDGRCKIHEVDAYSLSPDDLVHKREHAPGTDKHNGKGGHWYFFTPARRHETKTKTRNGRGGGRRQRAVGEGYTWHTEGAKIPVLNAAGEKRVGYKRKLSYGFHELRPGARDPTLTRLGWCMTEFGLDDDDAAGAGLVLCKVYVSPHRTETTYASVMKATAESKKRKAADDPHPDAPRPQTPRRQEPSRHLQEMERFRQEPSRRLQEHERLRQEPAGSQLQEIEYLRQEPGGQLQEMECLRQEPGGQLQEIEQWLFSDEDDTTAAWTRQGSSQTYSRTLKNLAWRVPWRRCRLQHDDWNHRQKADILPEAWPSFPRPVAAADAF